MSGVTNRAICRIMFSVTTRALAPGPRAWKLTSAGGEMRFFVRSTIVTVALVLVATFAPSVSAARRTGQFPDFKAQVDDATKRIAANPKDAAAYRARAMAYSLLGRDKEALKDYGTAITLEPKNPDAYYRRAEIAETYRDWNAAIADYTRLIAIEPGKSQTYFLRGRARRSQGNLEGAIRDCTQAIQLRPGYEPPYFHRGLALLELNREAEAKKDFATYLRLFPLGKPLLDREMVFSQIRRGERLRQRH